MRTSPVSGPRTWWRSLARAARWHRRALSAACAALAVLVALSVVTPPRPTTAAVVVARTSLPAGHTLVADDLTTARYPPDLVPGAALADGSQLLGKVLAAAVPERAPVTLTSTVSTTLTPSPGELLVPFHVPDASVLRLVQVGDRVSVVTTGNDEQVVTLARRVRVAALPEASGGSSLARSGGDAGGLVVVAADEATAARLAAFGGSQQLGIALG